jgi:hypothetical protein
MINLNSKYAIAFNELSVDVYKRAINQKNGQEYNIPAFYYPNLEQALEGIIDRSLVGDITELANVVDKIKELKSEIRDFLAKNSSVRSDSSHDLEATHTMALDEDEVF